MLKVSISEELKEKCPELALGIICCDITNTAHNENLWIEIEREIVILKNSFTLENIKTKPEIAATRNAYKTTGKDPNRYRPSAEALCRRILRNMELYQISTAVDLINLISIASGFSIGGFDADVVEGDVVAAIGMENEPFEAIGRGALNIGGMPVLRDATGAIGTPTSDVVRTSLRLESKRLYMNINAYRGRKSLFSTMDAAISCLKTYLCAENIESTIIG
ncbi:MAG: hypothetical protein LBH92_07045 [Bacteroidales bacterium]|nr:hypothetical protein [Bacteroidales bacterium]